MSTNNTEPAEIEPEPTKDPGGQRDAAARANHTPQPTSLQQWADSIFES